MGEIEEFIEKEIDTPVTGIVLYGSRARQDATPSSDTDVLVVTPDEAGKHYGQQLSIVSYTEGELTDVFERGTLMGDHLKRESKIIYDPSNRVETLYGLYVEPNHSRIREEIQGARTLLGVSRDEFEQHPYNFLYLARYICRVSATLLHREVCGTYNYSYRSVAATLGIPELQELGFHHAPTKEDWPRFLRLSALSGRILFGDESLVNVEPISLSSVIDENKADNPRLANLAYGLQRPEKLSLIRLFSTRAYENFPYVHPDSIP